MLALIVAASENRVIGRQGDLPWRLPADLRRFRKLTMGHAVIMGRRTYGSLPGPLPGRRLIVLTSHPETLAAEVETATSLEEALELCHQDDSPFVIGGASVYAAALPRVDRIYLTVVHAEVEGDTYLPEIDWEDWELVYDCWHAPDVRHPYAYSFRQYDRIDRSSRIAK